MPDDFTLRVGHALRQAVEFAVVPVHLAAVAVAVDAGQRLVAVFLVQILGAALRLVGTVLADHLQAVPVEQGGLRLAVVRVEGFPGTAPQCVVTVFGTLVAAVAVEGDGGQALLGVVYFKYLLLLLLFDLIGTLHNYQQ